MYTTSNLDSESESTLQGDHVFNQAFAGQIGTGVIETFRRPLNNPYEMTAHRLLGHGVDSANRNKDDNEGSKTTFFESPYWPGQHEFKSRGLLDSNSTAQHSNLNSQQRKKDIDEKPNGGGERRSLMENFGQTYVERARRLRE